MFNPWDYHLTKDEVLQICKVTPRTLTRWKKHGAPHWARELCTIYGLGKMPWANWQKWSVRGGILISPEGETWEQWHLAAYWIERQRLATLEQRLRTPEQLRLF